MQTLGRLADQAARCAHCSLSGTVCGLADIAGRAEIAAISGQRFVEAGQTIIANGGEATNAGVLPPSLIGRLVSLLPILALRIGNGGIQQQSPKTSLMTVKTRPFKRRFLVVLTSSAAM